MIVTGARIAVVIPTWHSEKHVGRLLKALDEAAKASRHDWQIIIVDDGSADDTWEAMRDAKRDVSVPVKAVRLSRNTGQHNALLTGLSFADADYLVTMDDDLQHDPADVDALVQALENGSDLAIAAYDEKQHSAARNAGGGLVDGLLRRIFKLPKTFRLTSFRAFRKVVSDQAVNSRSAYPYLTALLLANASRPVNVNVTHGSQAFRPTSYSLIRSLRLSANLLFGYTYLPVLAMIIASGLAITSAAAAFGWVVFEAASPGRTSPGWASIIAVMSLFHGFTLFSLAIIGVYVSRIHAVTVRRSNVDAIDRTDG